MVSRFMKRIFRMKPPTPRQSSTWDIKGLLEFLAAMDPPAGLVAADWSSLTLEAFKRFYLRSADKRGAGVFARAVFMCRLLRKAMQLAGICHLTGHSSRCASTSATARVVVPLETILVAAD